MAGLQDPRRFRSLRQARAGARRSQRAGRRRQGEGRDPYRAPGAHPSRNHQGRRQGHHLSAISAAPRARPTPNSRSSRWSRRRRRDRPPPVGFIATDWTDVTKAKQAIDEAPRARSSCWRTLASIRRRGERSALAARMAELGDIFVNDAFSAAHRAHAYTEAIAHSTALGRRPRRASASSRRLSRARRAGAAGDRHCRWRQGLDQARPARAT